MCSLHSLVKYFLTLVEKFRISSQPCNILSISVLMCIRVSFIVCVRIVTWILITIVCSLLSFVLSVDQQKLRFWALLFVKQQFKATLEQSYIDRYVLTVYCRSSSGDIRNLKQRQWQRQRQWKLHPKIVFVGFQISFFFPTLALLVCHRWPIFSGVEFGISWTLLMICGFQSKRFGSKPTNREGGSIWWHNTATCISLM